MIKKFALLRSAAAVSIFTTFSSLISFFVQLLLAQKFGAAITMDAYFAAVAVPQVVIRLLGLPLHQVFIPILKDIEHKNPSHAKQFTSFIFWTLASFFTLAMVIITVFSIQIAHLLIPGAPTETIVLASQLLKILGLYTLAAGIFFITQAIHIAHKSFTIPYGANMLSAITVVTYTFFFIDTQGIFAPAYGLLYGAIVEALINLATLPQSVFVKPKLHKESSRAFVKLFLPLAIGSFVYRSTPIIDRYFASFLETGNISALGYSLRILESMTAFLSSGMAIVLLPLSAEYSSKNDEKNLSNIFLWGLRAVMLLIIPTTAYLFFFNVDLVSALFQRGNFTSSLSEHVGTVLMMYSGALIALTVGGQMTNILYARKKHLTVVVINIVLLPVYIGLVYALSKTYGIAGIAFSYSAYTVLTVVAYVYFVRKLVAVEWGLAKTTLYQASISSVMMVLAIFAVRGIFSHTLYKLVLEFAVGVATYGITMLLIKNKEATVIVQSIRSRLHI